MKNDSHLDRLIDVADRVFDLLVVIVFSLFTLFLIVLILGILVGALLEAV